MPASSIITLVTDFGTADAYVGLMKGVIAGIAPGCVVVDLTHQVPPGAAAVAAMHLEDALPFFPPGAVHLVVVDPGVGTARRAIAAEGPGWTAVGPDNGCLTPALGRAAKVVELTETRFFRSPVSATFHGRDLFAPVAAHLARGTPLAALGAEITDPVVAGLVAPREEAGALVGEVAHVDHFGNLITTIRAADLAAWPAVEVEIAGRRLAGLARSYHEPPPEGGPPWPRALIGSAGRLEIALPDGNAARALGVGRGERVAARRLEGTGRRNG